MATCREDAPSTPSLSIHLDGFRGTFPAECRPLVLALLAPRLGEPEPVVGSGFYTRALAWASGARLFTDPTQANMGGRELLSLGGEAMQAFDVDGQLQLLADLHALGFKGTRVDPAADDHQRIASMDDVHEAGRAGHYCGLRLYDPRRPQTQAGELKGDTAYFGRRGGDGSGKYLRIYDKKLESDGAIDAIRYEVELSGERAAEAFRWLAACKSAEAFRLVLGGLIGGAIDFRERDRASSDRHVDRVPRLTWWEKLLELLTSAPIAIARTKTTLQRRVEWAVKSVGRILVEAAAVVEAQGMAGWELLTDALKRQAGKARQSVIDAAALVGGLDVDSLFGRSARPAWADDGP